MFKRLDLKLKGVLLTVAVFYMVLSSWAVYGTMESSGMESLQRMSVQYTGQQHKNVELYLRWLEETGQTVANREGLREALSGASIDESIQSQLDGLRASYLDLSSIVLYGQKGVFYASGNHSSLRSMDELSKEPAIARFLSSGQSKQWMALDASQIYYSAGAGTTRRSLFHFTKIKDQDGNDLGLLQLETSLSKVLGLFHSKEDSMYGGNKAFLVTEDGEWLDKDGYPVLETEDGNLLLYGLTHSEDRIAIIIAHQHMNGELSKLGALLIVLGSIMIVFLVWLVRRLSRSVIEPLQSLYHKLLKTMKEP